MKLFNSKLFLSIKDVTVATYYWILLLSWGIYDTLKNLLIFLFLSIYLLSGFGLVFMIIGLYYYFNILTFTFCFFNIIMWVMIIKIYKQRKNE